MSHAPKPIPIPTRDSDPAAFDLSHVVALITGGGTGIGRGIAQCFAALGAKVAITGRRDDKLKETADLLLAEQGVECLTLVGDVREEATIAGWVAAVKEKFGRLTCLVNNAGVIGKGSVLDTTTEEFDRLFDTNVRGLFLASKTAAPALIDAGPTFAPSIVNVASVTGTRPYANLLAYCGSKAAVVMMTECMALDLAPHGVRVNAVNPGVVRSELHIAGKAVDDYGAFLDRSNATHPIGRFGEPADIAWAVAFLVSREAAWITGHCMAVDGGRNCTSAR